MAGARLPLARPRGACARFCGERVLSYGGREPTAQARAADIRERVGGFWRNAARYEVWRENEEDFGRVGERRATPLPVAR